MSTSQDTAAHPPDQATGDRDLNQDPSQPNWSYEETVKQVETIMARIESGELELAEVFDQFAVAVRYLSQCETFLTQRQQQVDLLIETLTDDAEG